LVTVDGVKVAILPSGSTNTLSGVVLLLAAMNPRLVPFRLPTLTEAPPALVQLSSLPLKACVQHALNQDRAAKPCPRRCPEIHQAGAAAE
jgi:hypothetical protein